MLSETDVHYITGFLYLATRREDISVILGERVLDHASETHRDVDIVIAECADHGIIGVEVKDEARALHVGLVEALCQKFADMPSLREKWIVSASGFTEPAIRKASVHGVKCLKLIRGELPRFDTIDISHVAAFPIAYLEWRQGPSIILAPTAHLSEDQLAELSDESPVLFAVPSPTQPRTARELADHTIALATAEWAGLEPISGLVAANLEIELAQEPVIHLASGDITVRDARITGVVEWVTSVEPKEAACYLQASDGTPLAGAVLVNIRTGLLGMSASPSSQRLRLFHIPHAIRSIRPIRKKIGGGPSNDT